MIFCYIINYKVICKVIDLNPKAKNSKVINVDFDKEKKSLPKTVVIFALGVLSVLYLLNFTFGVGEFLPDNLPYFGNIDEFGAAMILFNVLKYFDIDLTQIFSKSKKK